MRNVELEIIAEDLEYTCRRGRCILRLTLDPGAAAAVADQLGGECFIEEPVEVEVAVEDFDYDCRRGGCLLHLELSEHEARRLRSYLASLCL